MKIKNRIHLLPENKINELYNIPNFTDQEMEIFFSLSADDHLLLTKYKTIKLKIYFIIQLGYFRATQQFYNFSLEDIPKEVLYVAKLYFDLPLKNINNKPYRTIIKSQQAIILNLYDYRDWSPSLSPQIETHLCELIMYYPKPEVVTLELFKYFEQIKVVIPSYRVLQDILMRKLSTHARYARLNAALYEYNKIFKSTHVLNLIDDIKLRQAIKSARNRTESYHYLQGTICQIYYGIFKGKRIVDNNVSAHAVRLLANKIISYNATILNIIYERLIATGASKSVIDNFIRISPVAWEHLSFTGRYNFTKDNSIMDLEKIVRFLEEKLGKNTKH